MRQPLTFSCAGETLIATLDAAPRDTGLLIVTGGRQTRIGPHRMMALTAGAVAAAGHPVFRFDRRGIGDSGGDDPGFRGSGPDIAAAAATFRAACPQMTRLYALGLCDGASAAALHYDNAGLDGLILLNPWVIETQPDMPPPAAIRAHYRERLLTIAGWRKLLTQGFSPAALLRGLRASITPPDQSLAYDVITSLVDSKLPVSVLLAERDATARGFLDQYEGAIGKALRDAGTITLLRRDTASHSFAGTSDHAWLIQQVIAALARRI